MKIKYYSVMAMVSLIMALLSACGGNDSSSKRPEGGMPGQGEVKEEGSGHYNNDEPEYSGDLWDDDLAWEDDTWDWDDGLPDDEEAPGTPGNEDDTPAVIWLDGPAVVEGTLAAGEWQVYGLMVPAVVERMLGTLDSFQAGLYFLQGQVATEENIQFYGEDCFALSALANSAVCEVAEPESGVWYLAVEGRQSEGDMHYQLTIEFADLEDEVDEPVEVLPLVLDVPFDGSLTEGRWRYFSVEVGHERGVLTLTLDSEQAEMELLMAHESVPDQQMYIDDEEDCWDWAEPGMAAECLLPFAKTGTWYLAVWSEDEGADQPFSLLASWRAIDDEEVIFLPLDTPFTLAGNAGQWQHFYVDVPDVSTSLWANLSARSGDVEMLLSSNRSPDEVMRVDGTADCHHQISAGMQIECEVNEPEQGHWFLSVWIVNDAEFVVEIVASPMPEHTPQIATMTTMQEMPEMLMQRYVKRARQSAVFKQTMPLYGLETGVSYPEEGVFRVGKENQPWHFYFGWDAVPPAVLSVEHKGCWQHYDSWGQLHAQLSSWSVAALCQ